MTDLRNETTAGCGNVPRLAMINDIAGFGRCSTTVSLPVISAMQVQVCPVPASILSNHLGFPICYFDDYTPHIREYLNAWKELGISFDGLYCGFLGSVEQMNIVEEFIRDFKPPFVLLDPVMGDHGKAYSTITKEHCERMRGLISHADLITPNITEACLLTGSTYKNSGWTTPELEKLCEKLSLLCPGDMVITGLQNSDCFSNYIYRRHTQIGSLYSVPSAGHSRPGTGDLFASILAADALHHVPLDESVRKAADFVALCIHGSEAAGIPVQEGVIFEKYLWHLFSKD